MGSGIMSRICLIYGMWFPLWPAGECGKLISSFHWTLLWKCIKVHHFTGLLADWLSSNQWHNKKAMLFPFILSECKESGEETLGAKKTIFYQVLYSKLSANCWRVIHKFPKKTLLALRTDCHSSNYTFIWKHIVLSSTYLVSHEFFEL